MRQETFDSQIRRLKATFRDSAYPDERVAVIWSELKSVEDGLFIKVINHLISEFRQPPVLSDFREVIASEREKSWNKEKAHSANEARRFSKMFGGEDIKLICQNIIDHLKGEEVHGGFTGFQKTITHAANIQPMKCRTCEDTGIVIKEDSEKFTWTYKCFCAEGSRLPHNYRVWRNMA